ncbi:MAG: transposase, partial [Desulfobacterales bacterium]|nr:transposase [Desulfobacterales bacterium]
IQLIAGRTGREYNLRKNRKGAFWEDRYHATAVETGDHLVRCLVYIDLNMVRTGTVQHPSEWIFVGYNEIQNPKQRYSLIDRRKLAELLGVESREQLITYHRNWAEKLLKDGSNIRDSKWTESIAVGNKEFVLKTQEDLGAKAIGRNVFQNNGIYELRESQTPYIPVFDPEKCTLIGIGTFYIPLVKQRFKNNNV